MADNGGLSYKEAMKAINLFVNAILECMGEGKEVQINKLFTIKWRNMKIFSNRLLLSNLVKSGVKQADLPPRIYTVTKMWRIYKTKDAIHHSRVLAEKNRLKQEEREELEKYINGEF